MKPLFSRYGVPIKLRSDNARNLTSFEFKIFLEEHTIIHETSAPLYPAANGEVERQMRSLHKKLVIANVEHRDWHVELNNFLMAYRSTPHTTTRVGVTLLFNV